MRAEAELLVACVRAQLGTGPRERVAAIADGPIAWDWVLRTGLCICAAVIPAAFIAGQVRGIPVSWRFVDAGFGVFGSIPLFYCLHLTRRMRAA